MKHSPVLFLPVLLILAGCHAGLHKQKENAVKEPASAFINDKAVWKGNLDNCFAATSDNSCLTDEVKKSGSPEALKSVQYIAKQGETGYVAKFTKEGPIGVAVIEYPFRANNNSGTLLIPSTGNPVDVEDFQDKIKANPAWLAFEKQHPDSTAWSPATLEKMSQTDNGISLTFSYPVKSCHACDDTGAIYISYDFTRNGNYLGHKVTDIQ
ncbi:hypothetical protein HP564_02675 [Pantoea sp. KPR_PJ]